MSDNVLTEREFAQIIAENGGRVYRVGGCVRDSFMGITPKDIDFSIVGMVKKNFKMLFPKAEECGKSFPVFRLAIDGIKREVAFARTERKVGSGYKGFRVSAKPKITIEEDLFRRDTTVNSMAQDSLTGEIIDPFQGREDIRAKVLRATSQHFSDDPMRALRLAGQSARFGFAIDTATLLLARDVKEELIYEPVERVIAELGKVLAEAPEPARFFKVLAETQLLEVTFQELAELSAEDFEKAMAGLNLVAKATTSSKLRFASLGLVMGQVCLVQWNQRMVLPGEWLDSAVAVNQIIGFLENPTPETIVDTIGKLRRGSFKIEELDLIITAAKLKILTLGPLKAAMVLPRGEIIPKTLQGKEIGEWLRRKHIEAIDKRLNSSS
ncbi:tRNA nucleotidyltransferase/poly(A) polymerase family protein [Pelosinus propionicus]|uniref:tRNA nucleotidyltransferase (CCA-adding enzyme) n=1 Tax=Pelosinus propionicus DSM 13327 TaxID=1123291 RepID=A0A1I4MTW4_9FIRM|nr:CCA tRNA nucleotidyltransferase [Pelosinus propionicus]SFM06517.1 tRNA nucleotidyltransferase (CCA-adding enzyme) [Pelosinus propionicus DSM 13327]